MFWFLCPWWCFDQIKTLISYIFVFGTLHPVPPAGIVASKRLGWDWLNGMGQCCRIKSCILWLNFREIDFYLWLCYRICFSCDLSHHAGRLDTISLILFNQNPREMRDLCPRFCRMFLNNRSLNLLVVRRLHHCRRMRYLNGILRGSCSIYCWYIVVYFQMFTHSHLLELWVF